MAQHEMKLQPTPFEQIKARTKTIEMRLNDPKRRAIQPGDTIVFFKEPNRVEQLATRVVECLPYPTFAELVKAHPPASMGFEESAEGYVRPSFYSAEDEAQYGALGIRIKVIDHG